MRASMPTKARMTALLDAGHTYETAARELGISPGLAFMVATGLPADGSDAPPVQELQDNPALPASSQHLVNPAAFNPTHKPQVVQWVKERAARELTQG